VPQDLTADQIITIVNDGTSQINSTRLNLTTISGDVIVNASGISSISSGVIVNDDISPTAEIAVSKLADGIARQLLQTSADGNEVEWASDIVIPGTLGVTGAATFSGNTTTAGTAAFLNSATFASGVTVSGAAAFSGTTTAPTAASGDSSTSIATTAFVSAAVSGVAKLDTVQTFTAVQTLTDPAIIGTILEDVFTISDGAAFEVDPGNGSIQLITLGANRTPKATNFAAGESITLMVNDGTAYTLTWSDATWGASGVAWTGGSAPTLATTGYTVLQFWKVSTQVYGAYVGDVA
jgi:hypothetical protein